MSLEEAKSTIDKAVRDYHNRYHSAIGMTPAEAWSRASRQASGKSQFSETHILAATANIREPRTLETRGVYVEYDWYGSDELESLFFRWGPIEVTVMYHGKDVSRIVVLDPTTGTFIKVLRRDRGPSHIPTQDTGDTGHSGSCDGAPPADVPVVDADIVSPVPKQNPFSAPHIWRPKRRILS